MSWIGIAVSAGVGAVVAVAATPALKGIKSDPLRNFIYLGVFFVSLAVAREWIAPMAERYYATSQIESEFLKNPAFVAMKSYEPQAYSEILHISKTKLTDGARSAEVFDAVAPVVQTLVVQRVPISSNAAAVQYLRATMDEVRFFFGQGGETCYFALFPDAGRTDFFSLPTAIQQADAAGLAAVLRDAKIAPQPIPTDEQFANALGPSGLAGLDPQYIPELEAIGRPKLGQAARRRTCEVILAVYDEIFKLPPNQAGVAVRHMLAQSR